MFCRPFLSVSQESDESLDAKAAHDGIETDHNGPVARVLTVVRSHCHIEWQRGDDSNEDQGSHSNGSHGISDILFS